MHLDIPKLKKRKKKDYLIKKKLKSEIGSEKINIEVGIFVFLVGNIKKNRRKTVRGINFLNVFKLF